MYYFYYLCGLTFIVLLNWCLQQVWVIEEINKTTHESIKKRPRLDIHVASYSFMFSILIISFHMHILLTSIFVCYFYWHVFGIVSIDVYQAAVCFVTGSIVGYYIAGVYHVAVLQEMEATADKDD